VGAAKPLEPAPVVAVAEVYLDAAEVRTDEARLTALERAELARDSALLRREDSADRAEEAKEPVVSEAKDEVRLASTLLREA